MTRKSKYGIIPIALLIMGSAILLISCSGQQTVDIEENEALMTEQSDSLVVIQSTQGKVSYRFETPLMERYAQAREPYMEFRKGVIVEKLADSTGVVESSLIADYAIFFENQQLWEAKGNVVATNTQGHVLETQQLFWNQLTKKIYSNIDSKITQGTDVLVGVGFESDESFEVWEFRKPRGRLAMDIEPNRDTTAVSTTPPPPVSPASPASAKTAGTEASARDSSKPTASRPAALNGNRPQMSKMLSPISSSISEGINFKKDETAAVPVQEDVDQTALKPAPERNE